MDFLTDFMEGVRDFSVVANPTKNTVHAFMNSLDFHHLSEGKGVKHSIVKIVIIKNISSVVLPVLFNYCAEPAVPPHCTCWVPQLRL